MINVTQPARQQILKSLAKRGKGLGIRIGIKTTGCSGLSYVLEYADQINDDDYIVMYDGFGIFVDRKHTVYVKEMTIDYVCKGLNEGFEFINPLEKSRCGCGESFRV